MESVILIILAALVLFIAFTFFKGKGNSSINPTTGNPDLENQSQEQNGEDAPGDDEGDSGSNWNEGPGGDSGDDDGSDDGSGEER